MNVRELAPASDLVLRDPADVMRLQVMGCAFPHRLSFMRILLRRLKREKWQITRNLWQLDEDGFGVAVLTAKGPQRSYSLVAFSHYLDPAMRSDRVIATQWDATFTLYDGVPSNEDIERLRNNIPKQEAGRVTTRELTVSRVNRSVRLFDHVVERLANGQQPDVWLIEEVGYLMRTTAVYGSGKLGAADFESLHNRPEFTAPFQAEMLTVYLIREFVTDLVEHIAIRKSPSTVVKLEKHIRRKLGIGNSTGLGMAPFLINHPLILNQWVTVKESALARLRSLATVSDEELQQFENLLARAMLMLNTWHTTDPDQTKRIAELSSEFHLAIATFKNFGSVGTYPWDAFYQKINEERSIECRELIVSLLIENHGTIVDDIEALYHADEFAHFKIDGRWTIAKTVDLIKDRYDWSLKTDFMNPSEVARFWYVSEEKLEPRLGLRFEEAGAELEQPLGVGRDIKALYQALLTHDGQTLISTFLLECPHYRHVVRRCQLQLSHPYSEVHDNVLSESLYAVDLLRFKLSFFGASRFDPRSDKWLRITMYQHAPYFSEIASTAEDDWFLPPLGSSRE